MLTPEYLAGAADEVVEIFAQVESDILADIVRRVVKTGVITDTAMWQIERAREAKMLSGDIASVIAKATGKSRKEINRLLNDAAKRSLAFDDAIYQAAGLNPPPISASPAIQAVLLQGRDTTLRLVDNFTKTAGTAARAKFSAIMDRAFLQVMTDAFTPQQALRMAVKELARNEVLTVSYPSGAKAPIESAARRAVMTGTNQAVSKLQLARAQDMGSDLVEVTAHAGARPTHEVWQGQVYSLSGKTKGYKNFYYETGYGSGDGLCGWNCYHNFYPYFEGLSGRSFYQDPSAAAGRNNDRDYENTQIQRHYENQVRKAKHECVAYRQAADSAENDGLREDFERDFTRASVLLKRREAQLEEWVQMTKGVREKDRESVPGFNRRVSAKAVWANRKAQLK